MTSFLSELANIATAGAVIFAAWQIWLSKKQAVTAFEDSLVKEYRDLVSKLPTNKFVCILFSFRYRVKKKGTLIDYFITFNYKETGK